jgi:hypothetical protein
MHRAKLFSAMLLRSLGDHVDNRMPTLTVTYKSRINKPLFSLLNAIIQHYREGVQKHLQDSLKNRGARMTLTTVKDKLADIRQDWLEFSQPLEEWYDLSYRVLDIVYNGVQDGIVPGIKVSELRGLTTGGFRILVLGKGKS